MWFDWFDSFLDASYSYVFDVSSQWVCLFSIWPENIGLVHVVVVTWVLFQSSWIAAAAIWINIKINNFDLRCPNWSITFQIMETLYHVDFFFNRRCQEEFKEVTSAPELHINHIGLTFFIGELMLNMKVCFIFESYVIHISVYSFSCS